MMLFQSLALFSLALSARATLAPNVPGMNMVWQETFVGGQGAMVDLTQWNVITDIHNNQELETYTQSGSNMQLSGGQTLQLVPQQSPTGEWTSSRIESVQSWAPVPGKVMQVQAALRGGNSALEQKQGMWPAFWMLGDSMRTGTPWPLCGELDIFEQINGQLTGYGTAHCDHVGGGACNEPSGLGESIAIPQDDEFHTWSLKIDRTSNNWQTETIQWFMDGKLFHTLTGAQMGDEGIWATLAHSPMFVILNLAVGGTWPGDPNEATLPGWGNMFEVQYVAVYATA
ncbi:glucan endo-1,3-beta-glucosidase A1 [Trichoderma asperellum]|uniref:Glucan endo-1,3-beta-glucosidase A1 n=1 Tax=Trichoderma asperellum TaxID=101201 RepID=A0A6V8QPX2_TRIAP|nr:glucan endo-1,3-beta-glucosidase A1 [Trichoderma asperellum]